jgi:hypothetical protein
MKQFAIGFLLVMSAGFSALGAQGVYGNWKFPAMRAGSVEFNAVMSVSQTTVAFRNTCTSGAISVPVTVSAPAAITPTTITIMGSAQDQRTVNGVTCSASITPSTISYVVSPDDRTATFFIQGAGQPFTLPRE